VLRVLAPPGATFSSSTSAIRLQVSTVSQDIEQNRMGNRSRKKVGGKIKPRPVSALAQPTIHGVKCGRGKRSNGHAGPGMRLTYLVVQLTKFWVLVILQELNPMQQGGRCGRAHSSDLPQGNPIGSMPGKARPNRT